MAEIEAGYYTVQHIRSDEPTICCVTEDEDEVEIMHYTPGYTRNSIFGEDSEWSILAGPWELPGD